MNLKKVFLSFAMTLIALCAAAQLRVEGVVINKDDNEPIIGATVQLKGNTSHGTATDADGRFVLDVPSKKSVLIITYVGMTTQEVPVGKGQLKVIMTSDSQVLSEVVVTGMQKVDKRLFTGATTSVDASKAKLDGVADISRSLEGRAAGVTVQNVSGTFGTAPKIRVRGATSIYGTSKPLWVVDGMILEDNVEVSADDLSSGNAETLIASAVAGLNADDIESFQILKDGSATSIYGARAMAGVIVITTKKGKTGHTTLNYTGEFTYRLKPSYSDYNICNSQEQMSIFREMEEKGWLEFASLANSSSSGIYGTMYGLMKQYDVNTGQYALENNRNAMNQYLRRAEMMNTNWFDLLFKNNIMQNHSVSISGGTDRARFYTSASVMLDPGWYIKSNVNRYTFNANADFDLSRTLTLRLLTSDSHRKQKAPGTLNQDLDVVSGSVSRSFDINPYSFAMNTSRALDPNAHYTRNYADFNIFEELEENYIDLSVTDLKFQAELNWKPIKGLELSALGSYRHNIATQNHYVTERSNQSRAYRAGVDPENATILYSNPYLYTNPDEENPLPTTVLPKGGIWYHKVNSIDQYTFRGIAQYNTTINRDHIISAMAGLEINNADRHVEQFEGWGMCYYNGNIPFIDYKLFKQQAEENAAYYGEGRSCNRNAAFFGTASYSYTGRYIINGTLRYEGSNQLGKTRQSRWIPTWNVSGAWNASEESWFQNPVVSHAKLRLSYSLTAESAPAGYANAQAIYMSYKPWRPQTEASELAIGLNSLANSELTFEKKHELDIGVDLGFLDNRINVVFDWFKRNNFDLIGRCYTQGVGGMNQKYANVAAMKSHGVEFTLSTRNIDTPKFSWTTDFTFTYFKETITDLVSHSRIIDLVQGTGFPLEGYPQRAIFSIPFMGLNDEGIPTFLNENGELTTSNHNFQEFTKLDNLVYEGPVTAPISGGFGNTFTWKGFHLNLFLTYAFGNKLRLTQDFASSYSDMGANSKDFKNRWVQPGDEAVTTIPVIASLRQAYNDRMLGYAYNAYNYSTERVASGSFIRVKEISLSYDLPVRVLSALRLSSASVKLQATNLFLLYADKKLNGQDPEFFNSGGVASPNPKQITFTLRFGL